MDDERFADVFKNPKYKRIPNAAKKVKIDKRFQGMFSDEKFKIKGTKDKRGRDIKISSKEDLKRYYHLSESDEGEFPNKQNIDNVKKDISPKNLSPDDGDTSEEKGDSDQETTDSYTDEEVDEDIDHKWGELDIDCPEILEATYRLALCNMSWDLITSDDLFTLFDSLKPMGGVIKNVKIYRSEYGKKMKAIEDVNGPFALINNHLGQIKDIKAPTKESNTESEDEENLGEEEEKFNMEKLRQYQINTMKYAYAIVECDSPSTAEHIYAQGNGLEFERTANLLDLRFVPDETTFECSDGDVLSSCDANQSLLSFGSGATKGGLKSLSNTQSSATNTSYVGTTKCLNQTKFDLTWDQADPKRTRVLEENFAILYQNEGNKKLDKVGKSKASKLKRQMRTDLMDSLISDDVPTSAKLSSLLAPPSSSSENESQHSGEPEPKPIRSHHGNGSTKMQMYRELLKGVLGGEEGQKDMPDKDQGSSESDLTDHEGFGPGDAKVSEGGQGGRVMEITWEPELQSVAQDIVENRKKKSEEGKLGPWEKYLVKGRNKKLSKKLLRQETKEKGVEGIQDLGDDSSGIESDHHASVARVGASKADLELLVMSGQDATPDSGSENGDALTKKAKRKFRRKKKNSKSKMVELGDGGADAKEHFEFDDKDSRFTALLVDPRYGLDPSNSNFKMTKGVQKILNRKTKKINSVS